MSFLKEFKEFAVKGNMIDMAIGIIIGAAFSSIVKSLVDDIIMPVLGVFTGGIDVSHKKVILAEEVIGKDGKVVEEAVILKYGEFIQESLDFLIVAFTIFVFIRFINQLKRSAEDPENSKTPTPKNIQLLKEIRDALVDRK